MAHDAHSADLSLVCLRPFASVSEGEVTLSHDRRFLAVESERCFRGLGLCWFLFSFLPRLAAQVSQADSKHSLLDFGFSKP